MVYSFESYREHLFVTVKVGDKLETAEFVGHNFTTDNETLSEALKKSSEFHKEESESGFWFCDEIVGANKKKRGPKWKVQSGSSGT